MRTFFHSAAVVFMLAAAPAFAQGTPGDTMGDPNAHGPKGLENVAPNTGTNERPPLNPSDPATAPVPADPTNRLEPGAANGTSSGDAGVSGPHNPNPTSNSGTPQ